MNKKLMLIFTSLIISPAFAMKDTEQIKVKSLKSYSEIEIDDKTNIRDIKNKLFEYEGVPVEQQELRVHRRSFMGLGFSNYSDPLSNESNVKEIMHKNNTAVFQLFLKLREKSEK